MRARTNPDLTYADFIYISQGRTFVSGFTGMMGGLMVNKIGLKATMILGCVIYWYIIAKIAII